MGIYYTIFCIDGQWYGLDESMPWPQSFHNYLDWLDNNGYKVVWCIYYKQLRAQGIKDNLIVIDTEEL